MKDISQHLLDIVGNSIRAGASLIEVGLEVLVSEEVLVLQIRDNGCGMSPEMVATVTDPFVTSRTTRKVGLGLPFLKMNAEQTGGFIKVESEEGQGTLVEALFYHHHIDCVPMGDLKGTMALIMSGNPNVDFVLSLKRGSDTFEIKSADIKEVLGDVSINHPKVGRFIKEMLDFSLLDKN
jgi:signal transduction histidine kinase